MERRTFLKIVGTAGVVAASGEVIMAGGETAPPDGLGVLVDLTACLGCRTCEYMCAEANGLPEPAEEAGEGLRETSESQFTVVSSFDTNAGPVFVKRQCMHCNQPACTSACLTKALVKTEEGPVVWRADKCMGCRYCMISCPFDVPKFEFNSPVPRIRKCTLCWERLGRGENPACVENCPNEALLFGKRSELLEEARKRIYQNPDQYVSHIY